MKLYELSIIASSKLSEEEANKINQDIISSLQDKGGALDNLNEIKLINLAYKIEKNFQAYFSSLTFYLKPEFIADLEKEIKNNKEIVRYLFITKQKPKATSRTARKEAKRPKKQAVKTKTSIEEIEEKLDQILEKGIEEEIK